MGKMLMLLTFLLGQRRHINSLIIAKWRLQVELTSQFGLLSKRYLWWDLKWKLLNLAVVISTIIISFSPDTKQYSKEL